jgi:hypothetical protein
MDASSAGLGLENDYSDKVQKQLQTHHLVREVAKLKFSYRKPGHKEMLLIGQNNINNW